MKHIICLAVWIVTFAVGGALFWTSNQVQDASAYNNELVSQIKAHQENITLLTAEWHYLNSPAYLESLADATFQEGADKPMMLADTADLPEAAVLLLPVRKPDVPESHKKAAPVLVAEAKKVQPVVSKTQVSKTQTSGTTARSTQPSPSKREFSMVLASWTQ